MRDIVEEESYKQRLKELRIGHQRMDEALEAVCIALAKRPDLFPLVPGTNIRRLRVQGCVGVPTVNIWFTYTKHQVRLLTIEPFSE
jgi:hypothetical protein